MFVLYAESRNLIHPDDPDAQDDYQANFSLDELRLDIHHDIEAGNGFDDFSEHSTSMWSRLQDLFRLVDTGEESLGIPPYNGGLFDDDRHEFLANHAVANRYIAEVIYRLGTTEADDGSFVLADYADLDTRHLGSIYEGLLEHEFRIAPEQYAAVTADGGQVWKPATDVSVADAVETVDRGELYVVNDDGERKATGAYYTPDYVVAYIVEETIDPLLDDIKADLEADGLEPSDREYFARFWQEVLDLKVLDPAMGSGHFLTKATGYLTEQVMEVVREQEIQSYDEQDLRREIAKECIYGVDLNGMAVELAKLSMWLETLAADQPLAFLDHHLKTGNSLVGSDITEVLSDEANSDEEGQITIFQALARVRQQTLEHVMDLMKDLLAIDNETLEDIKSMEEIYEEIRDDPLYQRLFQLANVHTAERLGVDVPEGSYEEMAQAIESDDGWAEVKEEDWFTAAQNTAEDEDFFHWELEYPEVFFGEEGEKRLDAGFDGIVGNPPYVFIDSIPEIHRDYYRETSESWDYRYDLYGLFTEISHQLLQDPGEFGFIIPHSILNNNSFGLLREYLLEQCSEIVVCDFTGPVFEDAANETMVLLTKKEKSSKNSLQGALIHPDELTTGRPSLKSYSANSIQSLPGNPFLVRGGDWVEKILQDECSKPLGEFVDAVQGLRTGNNKERLSQEKATDKHRKALRGQDIHRYGFDWSGTYVLYDRPLLSSDPAARQREEKYWEADEKILVQEIRNVHLSRRIVATIDNEKYIGLNTTNAIISKESSSLSLYFIKSILSSKLINGFFRACFVDNHIATQYIESIPIVHPTSLENQAPTRGENALGLLKDTDVRTPSEIENTDASNDDISNTIHDSLAHLAKNQTQTVDSLNELNLDLLDYLGGYSEGKTLHDIGFAQPAKNTSESVLAATSEERPYLRVESARVERISTGTVLIHLTARYKPDNDQDFITDTNGYTETDPLPALRITDLTETEADLIEAFVPVGVDEAGGFADFRETATKTNSLIDRLRKLTLPAVDDVREGLESYTETKARAEELEEKIERTDELIDEIVYELYELTDEEIEIVEEAVNED